MIDKREIIDIATEVSLNPHVVEKDYVLGWLLAGISAHHALQDSWVFKGGTCLKKCFFETYRFSEDLDFTLLNAAHIDDPFLKGVFAEIGQWIYDRTGIEVPAAMQEFDIYRNPRGAISCQGKIAYRGPVSPMGRNMPRVKLDLTADERVVLPPVRVPVFHRYSDEPEGGISVLAYAYEEAFGEKVRALGERTRPRDLYDVINLFRNADARPAAAVLLDVIRQKCEFKGIGIPRFADLEGHRGDLEAGWQNMLEHQLPALLPVESFWNELPQFFLWLEGGQAPGVPAAYALRADETLIRERRLRLPVAPAVQSAIEIIRFAAFNRLCIELDYRDEKGNRTTRVAEPYSLRRTNAGDILLHIHDVAKNAHRTPRVDRIEGARVTRQLFTPRYEIELSPQGPMAIPPSERRASVVVTAPRTSRSATFRPSGGITYIYQCPYCQKTFRRWSMDSKLNAHKNAYGMNCPGRTGFLVDQRY
jgi:predicted nucleotidyltransferase component of viral defense system